MYAQYFPPEKSSFVGSPAPSFCHTCCEISLTFDPFVTPPVWGIPLCSIPRWSSVPESSRAGHTLLALYFSRHFRSQQLWVRSHSQLNKTLATDEASPRISSDYSLIFDMLLCPWDDSAGVRAIYLQPTHIGTAKSGLSPSPCNFHWYTHSHSRTHSLTHTHTVRSCVETPGATSLPV